MPNAGHRWTLEEDELLLAVDDYEIFSEGYPTITADAYRSRRRSLLKKPTSLHRELTSRKHTRCKVCLFIGTLSQAEANEWHAELLLPVEVISHTAVVAALAAREVVLDARSVRRHRRNHIGR